MGSAPALCRPLCFTGVPGSAISANEKMGKHSELCTRSKMLVKSEFALSTGCKMSNFFVPVTALHSAGNLSLFFMAL